MKVKFRDRNPEVARAVAAAFPEWDVRRDDIWTGVPADIVVSPANVTGRMDGGIDQAYISRFGWQLEARLMRDIRALHGGCLPIGEARLITTYDVRTDAIPLMICAPTMAWPPTDVSSTENAYLAFRAALACAITEGVKALEREPVLVVPGLATATGRMPGTVCAAQMRRAWDEVVPHNLRVKMTAEGPRWMAA
jgi:O-acetyl-ADP-ribose deacetylase (regulator of RNase III)